MSCRVRKTEHCGAKNGGGHWGTRIEAKQDGKKIRRHNDKKAVLDADDFNALLAETRKKARQAGLKKQDLLRAIKEARRKP